MPRIPDKLNTSLKSSKRSESLNTHMSKSVHSYSNNNQDLSDCQLSDKNKDHGSEFLRNNLTPTQFRIFKALMELHLKYGGNLHPSLKRLADMANCARSTVQLAIDRFKELGIIETEFRTYPQTLIYRINEFYTTNRDKIASLVKNVAMMSLLLLSSAAGAFSDRYILKEKDVYLKIISKSRGGNVALELTKENYEEMRRHPDYVFDRTMAIFKRKMNEGLAIANHAGYFMGIFRQEVAKGHAQTSTNSRQFKTSTNSRQLNSPKTGTPKQWTRPTTGPYAEFKGNPKPVIESDFDISMKMEMKLHADQNANQNVYLKLSADKHLEKLSQDQRGVIMTKVHIDCTCRVSL